MSFLFVLLFSPNCLLLLIIIYHPSHRVSLWSWRNWPGRGIQMAEKSIQMLGWFVSLIWISHSNVILAHSNEFYFSSVFPLWISWSFECNSDAFEWILFFSSFISPTDSNGYRIAWGPTFEWSAPNSNGFPIYMELSHSNGPRLIRMAHSLPHIRIALTLFEWPCVLTFISLSSFGWPWHAFLFEWPSWAFECPWDLVICCISESQFGWLGCVLSFEWPSWTFECLIFCFSTSLSSFEYILKFLCFSIIFSHWTCKQSYINFRSLKWLGRNKIWQYYGIFEH